MIAKSRKERKVTLYVFLWFACFGWMGWFESVGEEKRQANSGRTW